jgi:hypothetical protein
MSAFKDDLAEKMKNPEFAYEYGRTERELEIIKLLEEDADANYYALRIIKGENK